MLGNVFSRRSGLKCVTVHGTEVPSTHVLKGVKSFKKALNGRWPRSRRSGPAAPTVADRKIIIVQPNKIDFGRFENYLWPLNKLGAGAARMRDVRGFKSWGLTARPIYRTGLVKPRSVPKNALSLKRAQTKREYVNKYKLRGTLCTQRYAT